MTTIKAIKLNDDVISIKNSSSFNNRSLKNELVEDIFLVSNEKTNETNILKQKRKASEYEFRK